MIGINYTISTNQNGPFGVTRRNNYVINQNRRARNKSNAFCQISNPIQLHTKCLVLSKSVLNSQDISNVITLNNTQTNTFGVAIIERKRATNFKKNQDFLHVKFSYLNYTPNFRINTNRRDSITTKIGLGRNLIDNALHLPHFAFENENLPDYRLNLSRLFGKKILAEATLYDKNLQPIIRPVRKVTGTG